MTIAIPVGLQYFLTSCLSVVDTMMVSHIGMVSAVGTASQIDSMNTLLSLGATSGTAIFLAQYYGAKDYKNVKRTFGFSVILSTLTSLLFFVMITFFSENIIGFYIDAPEIEMYAKEYLDILKFGFIPSSLTFAFSYGFRSAKNTKITLYVSTLKMALNIILNYLLIFGAFGFPQLGVAGAAIATVISQWVGIIIYTLAAFITKQEFIGKGIFSLEFDFCKRIIKRIYPLIANEIFFGFGETLFVKAYATLGIVAMDAYFVGNKIGSVFYIVIMGVSTASTIILGNTLGEGKIERAKKESNYIVGLAGILAVVSAVLIFVFAKPMVMLFGLQDPEVFTLAVQVVGVFAVRIALRLFIVVAFSALRAGGDSRFLAFLDSGIMWLVGVPLAFSVIHILGVTSITLALLIVQLEFLVRAVIGIKRLNSGKWAINLTNE